MIRGLIHGRVFKVAEAKTSANGKAFASGTIALDGQFNDGAPRFARVVAFGELAEQLAALPKGAAVAVAGKLEIGVWTPDSGKTEAQVKVLADDLIAVKTSAATVRRNEPVTP